MPWWRMSRAPLLMATTAERLRAHRGPAILSYGFRPFFLFGAVWAALAVAIWLRCRGMAALPTALSRSNGTRTNSSTATCPPLSRGSC